MSYALTVRQFHFLGFTNFCFSWSRTSVDNEGLHRWANRVTNSIARLKQCAFYANDVFIVNITLCVGNQVHMCLFERREDSNWCTKIVVQLLDEKPKLVVAISALTKTIFCWQRWDCNSVLISSLQFSRGFTSRGKTPQANRLPRSRYGLRKSVQA